jgi:Na+/melibiose symporter-like transporter
VLVSFYPISRERHARIVTLLEKRRRQRAARADQALTAPEDMP